MSTKFKVGDRVNGLLRWYNGEPTVGTVTKTAQNLGGEHIFLVEWSSGLVSWYGADDLDHAETGLDRAVKRL